MKFKLPEIEKTLQAVEYLAKKEQEDDMEVDYLITDTIWSKAKISKETNYVGLWLGANTMV